MLTYYRQQTRLLLTDPTFARFNDFDLISFVNTARGQLAGEGSCVRVYGSLALVVGQRSYPFSTIAYGAAPGIGATNNVRTLWYQTPGATGQTWVTPRQFEWFGYYRLNQPVTKSGQPTEWAQQGQGQAGTIFVDPLPDQAYVCPVDVAAAPIPLVNDGTAEAIPALWQDAVPYFAAYLAALTASNNDLATKMLELYGVFVRRARMAATSEVLSSQYSQTPDLVLAGRLGVTQPSGSGSGGQPG